MSWLEIIAIWCLTASTVSLTIWCHWLSKRCLKLEHQVWLLECDAEDRETLEQIYRDLGGRSG